MSFFGIQQSELSTEILRWMKQVWLDSPDKTFSMCLPQSAYYKRHTDKITVQAFYIKYSEKEITEWEACYYLH